MLTDLETAIQLFLFPAVWVVIDCFLILKMCSKQDRCRQVAYYHTTHQLMGFLVHNSEQAEKSSTIVKCTFLNNTMHIYKTKFLISCEMKNNNTGSWKNSLQCWNHLYPQSCQQSKSNLNWPWNIGYPISGSTDGAETSAKVIKLAYRKWQA